MNDIIEGTQVSIHPHADCDGEGKPHKHQASDGRHGEVTGVNMPGTHTLFVLFKPGGKPNLSGEFLPLGRCYRPDELEPLPPRA